MILGQDNPSIVFELIRWLGPGGELLDPVEWRTQLAGELAEMLGAREKSSN